MNPPKTTCIGRVSLGYFHHRLVFSFWLFCLSKNSVQCRDMVKMFLLWIIESLKVKKLSANFNKMLNVMDRNSYASVSSVVQQSESFHLPGAFHSAINWNSKQKSFYILFIILTKVANAWLRIGWTYACAPQPICICVRVNVYAYVSVGRSVRW